MDPQIVVGLLVDRTGFPLEIGCFEGNHAETHTIVPIVRQFQERHDITGVEMVVAADAGMLSASNLTDLDDAGLKFIVGSRVTKAPGGDLASHFHWHGNAFTNGQIVDTITPQARPLEGQQRPQTRRTGVESGRSSECVAGGVAVLDRTSGAGREDVECAGSPRPGRRRRRYTAEVDTVRQDHRTGPQPRYRITRTRSIPLGLERVRHECSCLTDGSGRGDREIS